MMEFIDQVFVYTSHALAQEQQSFEIVWPHMIEKEKSLLSEG